MVLYPDCCSRAVKWTNDTVVCRNGHLQAPSTCAQSYVLVTGMDISATAYRRKDWRPIQLIQRDSEAAAQ